ncbi:MAG: tetratricopeptide repeat protein, partial [candidate division WOR-3 bacterium]
MELAFLIIAIAGLIATLILGFLQVIIPFLKGEVTFSKKFPFVTATQRVSPIKVAKRVRPKKVKKKGFKKFLITIVMFVVLVIVVVVIFKFWLFKEEPITKIPIGVMFCDNQTGEQKYDYLRKVLADVLITDLGQSRYLHVMTFPRMFDLLKSLGYEDVEIIDVSMGFELCKLAGAQAMVLTSLTKSGDVFVLNAHVLNVETKELIASPYRVTGEGEESILGNLVDDLTDRIKIGLEISARKIQEEKKDVAELTTTSIEAYKYYIAGQEAAFRMYNQEAINNLEKAIGLDSTFVEAYEDLVRQYYTLGENEKAIQTIEKVKSLSGTLSEENLVKILALEAYIKHDWDLAINYYNRLISINPQDISAHLTIGTIYYQKKMVYDKGIAEFEKVLELDPQGLTHNTSYTYNVLGWAYLRKNEFEKAHTAFKKYVALLPNQVYPLNCLADFYLIVGNYDQAITNLKQSLEINPEFTLTLKLLGETYLAKGMYNKAFVSYKRYLALAIGASKKAEAHFYLAKFYYVKDDYNKALQECQQSLDLNPESIEAHWIQGLSFAKKEMFTHAEAETLVIKELIEKTNIEELKTYYYHLAGELFLHKGLHHQALENFKKATDIESLDRTFFVNALGEAYFKVEKLNMAVEKLEAVLKINPNYAQTHYLLGLVY